MFWIRREFRFMIAHFDHKKNQPPHLLEEHKEEMLTYMKEFSLSFDNYSLTEVTILLHDVGKKSTPYQLYVQDPNGKRGTVQHALGGAYVLFKRHTELLPATQVISSLAQLIIAGHHSGLLDVGKGLKDRYDNLPEELKNIETLARNEGAEAIALLKEASTGQLKKVSATGEEGVIYIATLARFSMSALVDADWLSTEAYFSAERAENRKYEAPSFRSFQQMLDEYCEEEFKDATGHLSQVKRSLQMEAKSAGNQKHSFFTLHAPTGTGKSIAALQFALSHANEHRKRRIITALPLMNLTEEMGQLYRDIFGEAHVVEDHSSIVEEARHDDSSIRLAAENWNRPFVVTTTVQLFESLFHHKPMKVRKLHRLYGSIIILDEYHKLPLHVLRPILKQLDILQKYFDVTVVMMSATPFALSESREIQLFDLLRQPLEITDRTKIFSQMPKRVNYKWLREKETIESIAEKIVQTSSVLTIVNTRKEAQLLFKTLKKTNHTFDKIYHLSTTMCAHHRQKTLKAIKEDLGKRRIAVVSTSVLEAGIDISFPVIYRMLAPLDSIIQTAGRSNRYGGPTRGLVVLFELESSMKVESSYGQGIEITRHLLREKGVEALDTVELFVGFYKKTFSQTELDKYSIENAKWHAFRTIGEQFRMIEDTRQSVVCTTYKEFDDRLLQAEHSRAWWRDIQPYTVPLSNHEQVKVRLENEVRFLESAYDDEMGVVLEGVNESE